MAKEPFQQPLHAYLVDQTKLLKDITKDHSFVGYSPLIFVLSSSVVNGEETIEIAFTEKPLETGLDINKAGVVARLGLKKINQLSAGEVEIIFYEGVHGHHRFIPSFNQKLIQLNNHLHQRKPGNVYLGSNLYRQVQIAYAIPRKISVITVGENNLFNLFPTDLHGQVVAGYYVISLRHEGYACKQVESAKKIVLSDMEASAYKMVYGLGKNHMQPLKEISAFPISDRLSQHFNLPLPMKVVSYKELELERNFIHGIHKLLLFRINFSQSLSAEKDTLVHIHNTYATWRHKKGLKSNYLLR